MILRRSFQHQMEGGSCAVWLLTFTNVAVLCLHSVLWMRSSLRTDGARASGGWILFNTTTQVLGRDAHAGAKRPAGDWLGPQHPRIYIADVPAEYTTDILDLARSSATGDWGAPEAYETLIADPLGPLLSVSAEGVELRKSDMYGLDMMMHAMLMRSPLQTMLLEEADLVFVPFYITTLFAASKRNQTNRGFMSRSNQTLEGMATRFMKDLAKMAPRLHQIPHFMFLGRTEGDFTDWCEIGRDLGKRPWGGDDNVWGWQTLCHPNAAYVTFLTIEAMQGLAQHERVPLHDNVITVPYPSHSHLSWGAPYFRQAFDEEAVRQQRKLLVSSSWATRLEIRERLRAQCEARPSLCQHHEVQVAAPLGVEEVMQLTASAWFQFHPRGDTALRSAIFDCLGAGTIPAFAHAVMPFLLPFSDVVDWRECSVNLDESWVLERNGSAIDVLAAVPIEDRFIKMRCIQRFKQAVLYSVAPAQELIRYDLMHAIHPRDDAFTASMKALLRSLCRRSLISRPECRPVPGTPETKAQWAANWATAAVQPLQPLAAQGT